MGSSFSFLVSRVNPLSDAPQWVHPGLGDLPESCVASFLVHLDPPEICRLALLNRSFRGASSADFVWESKLPPNYDSIIERVFDKFPPNLCKKEIYARLCRPNSFDGGAKKIWLDKSTGKTCVSISSNALAITGIDDRRYWTRIPTEESRFSTIAYLQQTWWLEVVGDLEFPFPTGPYSVYFKLQLGRPIKRFGKRACNLDNVHGWAKKPVQFQLSTPDSHQLATSQCYLGETGRWIYYHVGDFMVEDANLPTRINFSMTQIDCTHTKGGLCVDSVIVCGK